MAVSYLAKVYRERAEACFTLAKTATDPSSSSALEKLGRELIEAAEAVEPTATKVPSGSVVHSRNDSQSGHQASRGTIMRTGSTSVA